MKITKIGHCCLLVEDKLKILTDPGAWITLPKLTDLDLVLITHEHQDHLHIDSLKQILVDNPNVKIITNSAVGKLLAQQAINFTVLEDGQQLTVGDTLIEGFGDKHALIYEQYGQVQNTGYMIAGKLFYPGDALHNPNKPVQILALPVSGPWMKVSDAIDYAKSVDAQIYFPVHDGYLKIKGFLYFIFANFLKNKFKPLEDGESINV